MSERHHDRAHDASKGTDAAFRLSAAERDVVLWARAICNKAAAHAEHEGREGDIRIEDYEAAVRSSLNMMANLAAQADYGGPMLPIEIAALIRVVQTDGR